MGERRYKAFISYSHRDKAIANWLHHNLETYRLPKGITAADGAARLHPIFKDREELPAADSLGEAIAVAIESSDALIVLCSPEAAASPWIAKEVDSFKRVHGDRNVFPVIVSGEPPGNFPAPLLVHYENGKPTEGAAEPIAADLRPEGDGKKLGKLKLVAGLTGVDLDSLVQRDAARKQRRMAMVAAASLVGMVGTSGLALYAIDQRNEAREQRAEADGLIEYMLTDLRKQLEPVGRLEVLDGVGKRAMDYYARQKLEDLSATELGRRVRATQLVAEVQNLRGNNEAALPAFEQAARTTAELLARKPDDPERLFNHGQSLFWVGYIAWQHGKMGEARKAMEGYADVSTRLAAMDRSNLEWQMEEAYSLSNLGTMDFEDGKLRSALEYFRKNLAAVEAIEAREGRANSRAMDRAGAISWISTTLTKLGRIDDAIKVRQRELDLYSEVLSSDPSNNEVRRANVFASGTMGQLLAVSGQKDKAKSFLDPAISEGLAQISADPENTLSRELVISALRSRALLNWHEGRHNAAREDIARRERIVGELVRRDPANTEWSVVAKFGTEQLKTLASAQKLDAGLLHEMSKRQLAALDPENFDHLELIAAAHLISARAHRNEGDQAAALDQYQRVANLKIDGEAFEYRLAALQVLATEYAGNSSQARKLRDELAERGIDPMIDDLFR